MLRAYLSTCVDYCTVHTELLYAFRVSRFGARCSPSLRLRRTERIPARAAVPVAATDNQTKCAVIQDENRENKEGKSARIGANERRICDGQRLCIAIRCARHAVRAFEDRRDANSSGKNIAAQ